MSVLNQKEDGYSEVIPLWKGETVVLIGGGPSLTQHQIDVVRAFDVCTIAINDAYSLAPWADVCYFADAKWWGWHKDKEDFKNFVGQKCSIQTSKENIKDSCVHFIKNAHEPYHGFGLSLEPDRIVTGRNSGYQALNIAVLAGAKKIVLLGFDGASDVNGRSHWFGEHPSPVNPSAYEEYRRAFSAGENAIKDAGVRVINCSPGSKIDSFEKMDLEEALAE